MFKKPFLPILISLFILLFISCGTESTPTYTLTTSVNGEGTISPSNGDFEEGETVTLTGTPSEGWNFDRWSGDGSGTSTTYTFNMDGDKNIIGNFTRKDYPLTITIEGEGSVDERIVSQPKTTDYTYETVVELSPNPSEGWSFVGWGGDLTGSEYPKQITIDGEKNVTVTFEPIAFLGENGVTIMCPNSEVGDIGIVNGVEYEVVDRELLIQRWEEGKGSFETKVCVSLIADMSRLFKERNFNEPIGNWDVSNVSSMRSMFSDSPFNQPIGEWDVNSVTDMGEMFYLTNFNQPIENWDVGNVKSMDNMFRDSKFNQPIGSWDVSSVENMFNLFFDNKEFNQPIGNWDVSSVKSMSWMFSDSNFNQPIGDWDVSSVTDMSYMFAAIFSEKTPFNHPIGNWDVSSVTDMEYMFNFTSFNQPISNWCVWRFEKEPNSFSAGSPLTEENKPVWGTCPD